MLNLQIQKKMLHFDMIQNEQKKFQLPVCSNKTNTSTSTTIIKKQYKQGKTLLQTGNHSYQNTLSSNSNVKTKSSQC